MDDLYKEIILDHYQNPRQYGRIENPDAVVELDNPVCGDKIKVYLKVEENKIKDLKFEAQGCVISIASASILFSSVIGVSLDQVLKYNRDTVREKLKIELGPTRLKCALLPLEALQKAVKNFKLKKL